MCPSGWLSQGFFWIPGQTRTFLGDLPGGVNNTVVRALNAHDNITGYSDSAAGTECIVWDPVNGLVSLGDLPGGQTQSLGLDINDAGWIVGGGCDDERCDQSILYIPGVGMLRFDDWAEMPFPTAGIKCINNEFQMAGAGVYSDGNLRIFFWDPADGYTWLPSVVVDLSEGYVNLSDMNDLGWIVGSVFVNNQEVSGCLWDRQRGARLIRDLMDPCADSPLERASYVKHVNNRGWMTAIDDAFQNLAVLIPYIPGDLDEDEDCDLQDLAYLLASFGTESGATYTDGDLDCDQDVDLQDLAILLANFGETLP